MAGLQESRLSKAGAGRDKSSAAFDPDAYAALMLGLPDGHDLPIGAILEMVYRPLGPRALRGEGYGVADFVDADFVDVEPRWSQARSQDAQIEPVEIEVAPEPEVRAEARCVQLVPVAREELDFRPAGQLDQLADFFPSQQARPKSQPGRSLRADLSALAHALTTQAARVAGVASRAGLRALSRLQALKPSIEAAGRRIAPLAEEALRLSAGVGSKLTAAARSAVAHVRRTPPGAD